MGINGIARIARIARIDIIKYHNNLEISLGIILGDIV